MKAMQKRFLIGLALIGVIVLLRFLGVHNYFTLEALRNESIVIQNFVENYYEFSALLLVGIFALMVMFAIPVTPFLTLAAGYFFGAIPGPIVPIGT